AGARATAGRPRHALRRAPAVAGPLSASRRGRRWTRGAPADALPRYEHVLPRSARRGRAASPDAAPGTEPPGGTVARDAAVALRVQPRRERGGRSAGARAERPRTPDRGVGAGGLHLRRPRRAVPRARAGRNR